MSLEEAVLLGEGRAGRVFKRDDLAIKVFVGGDSLTKLVNYILQGAPNPYIWNEDAVWSAHHLRNILSDIVELEFDEKLRVAKSFGVGWNEELKGYELHTEFVEGRGACLHHPYSKEKERELEDLTKNIMPKFIQKAKDAGLYGLVWQAGYGNPVAAGNFLLETNDKSDLSWVFIDSESGVPALAPMNFFKLFNYYIPKSIKFGRPMFDDIDFNRLKEYVAENKERFIEHFGTEKFTSHLEDIEKLEMHHEKWKSMKRSHRSITYNHKKGNISDEDKDFFLENPLAWYARESVRIPTKGAYKLFVELPIKVAKKVVSRDTLQGISNFFRFTFSEKYRNEVTKEYLEERVGEWKQRGMLEEHEAQHLCSLVEKEGTTTYLADFMTHMMLKPLDITLVPLTLSYLLATDTITIPQAILGQAIAGGVIRTIYSSGRLVHSTLKPKSEKSWVKLKEVKGFKNKAKQFAVNLIKTPHLIALATGWVISYGNTAYLNQMLVSTVSDRELGKFLLYDSAARTGRALPIYGEKDSLIEHLFNRGPDLIIWNRSSLE